MSDGYRHRIVDDELDELLPALPALALEGPKGVGKTATALRRARTVRRLDDAGQLALAAADPDRVLEGPQPILLDEWQRALGIWDRVRRAVDDGAAPGSFLLTGSVVPTQLPAHSGAGRIATLRMRPMALSERGLVAPTVSLRELLEGARAPLSGRTEIRLAHYAEEIVRSGFPGIRRLAGRPLRIQLDTYLERVVERDFDEVGHRVRAPGTLLRWMAAYAAATGTTATYETIRAAATSGEGAAPSRTTTQPYRDALERLFLLDPLPAWAPTRNRIARLAGAPKHHLADPALAARLLDVGVESLLEDKVVGPPIPRDGTLLGALFESLVALSVRVYAQPVEASVGHLRTKAGEHEVDLIVERGGRVVAIETKLAQAVTDADVRHLNWLAGQLGDDLQDAIIVTTGSEAYRRPDGVGVVPAALLGP
jgi:predicted AAA+ superfamily ATPase